MTPDDADLAPHLHRRPRWRYLPLAALSAYILLAYLLVPAGWRRYEHRHPGLDAAPTLTHTANGIPGDPLNVALIGAEADLHRALLAAGWFPADRLTFDSSLRIAADTVLRRSYTDAPVSHLYLWQRPEDLAFEQPVGRDPRQRHHVRFWRSDLTDSQGRPLWLGAATFDTRVGFSHTTGQITHHIAPNVDADRDLLFADLRRAGALAHSAWLPNFQSPPTGKNGGGDRWHTDGRLAVGVLQRLGSVLP